MFSNSIRLRSHVYDVCQHYQPGNPIQSFKYMYKINKLGVKGHISRVLYIYTERNRNAFYSTLVYYNTHRILHGAFEGQPVMALDRVSAGIYPVYACDWVHI